MRSVSTESTTKRIPSVQLKHDIKNNLPICNAIRIETVDTEYNFAKAAAASPGHPHPKRESVHPLPCQWYHEPAFERKISTLDVINNLSTYLFTVKTNCGNCV